MVQAIVLELERRKDYLGGAVINTVYLGGGTPGLLSHEELDGLLAAVNKHFTLSDKVEITLEANPDDISIDNLSHWKSVGVNRLSIGLQSFNEEKLRWMNRTHNAQQSKEAVLLAQGAGFNNLNIDLIYALPHTNHIILEHDLEEAIALKPSHISAYNLTIEPETVFGKWYKKGQLVEVSEDFAAQQFEMVSSSLRQAGYHHYEVSNFAKPGLYSKHNTAYWAGTPWLGVGPSAHSFNGEQRHITLAHNHHYLVALQAAKLPVELDPMSSEDVANEYILTSLRTMWGFRPQVMQQRSGIGLSSGQQQYLFELMEEGLAFSKNGAFILHPAGWLIADHIASKLFV